MKTIKYLQYTYNALKDTFGKYDTEYELLVSTLGNLKACFNIGYTIYPEQQLINLKYSQIDSPKTNPIVMECRGLVVAYDLNSYNTFSIACRPFDRFFNAGECTEVIEGFDITRSIVYDKVDGSLIKIYCHKDTWYVGTSGTALAESTCNGYDITFKELVLKALEFDITMGNVEELFQSLCNHHLEDTNTYLFELTCLENRVVTLYEGYTIWLLAIRDNSTGDYEVDTDCHSLSSFGVAYPTEYRFNSVEDCIESSKKLPDLLEGYVCYDPVSGHRIKVKSPSYVAVHRLKGDSLNPRRFKELVLTNEQEEFLLYFPEYKESVRPYVDIVNTVEAEIKYYSNLYSHIQDQKEFALHVKDLPFSHVLFITKKLKEDPIKVFHEMDLNYKCKIIDKYPL